MTQALPLGPSLPLLADRPTDVREPTTDDQAANRQAFGQLLDRFSRPAPEPVKDAPKKSPKARDNDPADDRTVDRPDPQDAPVDDKSADDANATGDADPKAAPAKPKSAKQDDHKDHPPTASGGPTAVTPTATLVFGPPPPAVETAEVEANPKPAIPAEPASATSAKPAAGTENQPPTGAAAETATAAASLTAAQAVAGAEASMPPTASAPADNSAATATAAALRMDRAAVPSADDHLAAVALAAGGDKSRSAGAPQRGRDDAGKLQFGQPTRGGAKSSPAQASATTRASMAQRFKGADASLAAEASAPAEAAALTGSPEGQATAQRSSDALPLTVSPLDAPRGAVASYHRADDIGARLNVEGASPVDQLSIRLAHAAADGKRAIQVHLHPAELGSIDVKMQWQGDRLTAQFTVDRPETLAMLRSDQPALERTLSQAGINLDSGSLSFSLRQQHGNASGSGQGSAAPALAADGADAGDGGTTDLPLGQIVRDGILSIRV